MEDIFASECSSGCESGWTLYLEHSTYPSHSLKTPINGDDFICKKASFAHEDGEEEDMSMVSDASSGPPHFQEQEQQCYNNNNNGVSVDQFHKNEKRQKMLKKPVNLHRKVQDLPSSLDDTASSPFFNFSNNNPTVANNQASMEDNTIVDYSQGYSTTYFGEKATYQEHFGFFQPSATQFPQNQWFEGKRWA